MRKKLNKIIDESCVFCNLKGRRCEILTELNCENCSFFKTEKEYREGLEKYPYIKPNSVDRG